MFMESDPHFLRERMYRFNEFEKASNPVSFGTIMKFLIFSMVGSIICMFINIYLEITFLVIMLCLFIVFLFLYFKMGIYKLKRIKKQFDRLPEKERKKYKMMQIPACDTLIEWPVMKDSYDDVLEETRKQVERARNAPCKECFFRFVHSTRDKDVGELVKDLVSGDLAKQMATGCYLGIVPFVVGADFYCSEIDKRDASIEHFKKKFNAEDLLNSLNELKDEIVSIVNKNEKEKGDVKNGMERDIEIT